MSSALLIGIAKPAAWPLVLAAVSMPMTSSAELNSGPPESPDWIGASVTMTPLSFSEFGPGLVGGGDRLVERL